MRNSTIVNAVRCLMFASSICSACCGRGQAGACCTPEATDANGVEATLKQLKQKTANLKSYQAQVEYLFSQPLLESETLKKGALYYQRSGKTSKLRMNFQTLKENDEKEQRYVEHFIFDGVWLTHIDYQIENSERRQLAEPNEPVDVFDLASKNLPVVGFTRIDELNKQFEVSLVEQEKTKSTDSIKLHLKTRPDSIHEDDYTHIDVWLDKKSMLPAEVVAVTIDGEVHQIKLLKPKVNKIIDGKIFDFRIPRGFSSQTIPLEKNTDRDD